MGEELEYCSSVLERCVCIEREMNLDWGLCMCVFELLILGQQ